MSKYAKKHGNENTNFKDWETGAEYEDIQRTKDDYDLLEDWQKDDQELYDDAWGIGQD